MLRPDWLSATATGATGQPARLRRASTGAQSLLQRKQDRSNRLDDSPGHLYKAALMTATAYCGDYGVQQRDVQRPHDHLERRVNDSGPDVQQRHAGFAGCNNSATFETRYYGGHQQDDLLRRHSARSPRPWGRQAPPARADLLAQPGSDGPHKSRGRRAGAALE